MITYYAEWGIIFAAFSFIVVLHQENAAQVEQESVQIDM